jgi:hypothetical protein
MFEILPYRQPPALPEWLELNKEKSTPSSKWTIFTHRFFDGYGIRGIYQQIHQPEWFFFANSVLWRVEASNSLWQKCPGCLNRCDEKWVTKTWNEFFRNKPMLARVEGKAWVDFQLAIEDEKAVYYEYPKSVYFWMTKGAQEKHLLRIEIPRMVVLCDDCKMATRTGAVCTVEEIPTEDEIWR